MTESIKNVFQKLIMEEISISEFENWLYKIPENQDETESELYLELISFNFKQSAAKEQLTKELTGKLFSEEEIKSWKLRNIFSKYGWFKERAIQLDFHKNTGSDTYDYAKNILTEFGGLNIGQEKISSDYPPNEICFFRKPKYFNEPKVGEIYYIADTSRSYAIIGVGKEEEYYILVEPIDTLYFCGKGFDNVMGAILFNTNELIKV